MSLNTPQSIVGHVDFAVAFDAGRDTGYSGRGLGPIRETWETLGRIGCCRESRLWVETDSFAAFGGVGRYCPVRCFVRVLAKGPALRKGLSVVWTQCSIPGR